MTYLQTHGKIWQCVLVKVKAASEEFNSCLPPIFCDFWWGWLKLWCDYTRRRTSILSLAAARSAFAMADSTSLSVARITAMRR